MAGLTLYSLPLSCTKNICLFAFLLLIFLSLASYPICPTGYREGKGLLNLPVHMIAVSYSFQPAPSSLQLSFQEPVLLSACHLMMVEVHELTVSLGEWGGHGPEVCGPTCVGTVVWALAGLIGGERKCRALVPAHFAHVCSWIPHLDISKLGLSLLDSTSFLAADMAQHWLSWALVVPFHLLCNPW